MKDPRAKSNVHDPRRLASLERTDLLDTVPEPYFDRITRLVCKLVGTQTALLSLVSSEKQFFKSACGFSGPAADARETPLSHSFCRYVVDSGSPFIVTDARKIPELKGHGAVEDLGVVSYLGVPVHAPDGEVIGSLCALGADVRDWSDDDLATMRDLAALVDEDLALRERAKASDQLAKENAILAREYHHRVKNALAVSSSLVKLSGRDATSVADLVEKAGRRLAALGEAHDQLIHYSDSVDLEDLSLRLLLPYYPTGSEADVDGPKVQLRHDQVTPICLFLHELATNSAKYGAFKRDGHVVLRWTITNQTVAMDWNEKLTDAMQRSPEGFGSQLLAMAARQLGGSTKVTWSEDGLTVSLDFPA